MTHDEWLVLGLILCGFAIPAIMSAWSDRRRPRASMLVILIAGGIVIYALQSKPGGYRMAEVPEVFIRVIAKYVN